MFEALIAQAGQTFAGSGGSLIGEIGLLLTAVGGIIVAVAGFMKAGKAKDFAIQAGQVASLAGQKAVESKDRVKTVLEAVYELAPEDKKAILTAMAPEMDKITEEVQKGTEQMNKIGSTIPEFNANRLDVPRESFDTKPKVSVVSR